MDALRQKWLDLVVAWRLHPDAPANDRFWAPELETCSRDRLVEIQNEKLEVLVPYLLAYSPFYRDKFARAKLTAKDIKSVDDLVKVPPTTKMEMVADVAANPPWGSYLAIDDEIWKARGWMMFATSGTTAAPRAFRHTTHDMQQWAWNDARGLWAMGIRPEQDVAMIAFGYAPHVFFWGVHYAFNLMGIPVIPAGSLDTARRAMFINTFEPTLLCATPSYAFYLGNKLLEMGQDPRASSVNKLLVGGEPGASVPATKQRLEQLWDARVFEFYGTTEVAANARRLYVRGGIVAGALGHSSDGRSAHHGVGRSGDFRAVTRGAARSVSGNELVFRGRAIVAFCHRRFWSIYHLALWLWSHPSKIIGRI